MEINMQRALKSLDNMIEKIPNDVPTFRGIPVSEFDKEPLIKICKVFANEWHKAQQDYYDCLRRIF